MAERSSTPNMRIREGSNAPIGSEERLPKWLVFSLILHVALIGAIFLAPMWPTKTRPMPVYTVDLVGGEKIGRANFGTELTPAVKPPVKRPEPDRKAGVPEQAKKEKASVEEVKAKPPEPEPRVVEEKVKPKPPKPEPRVVEEMKVKAKPPEPKPRVEEKVAAKQEKAKAEPPAKVEAAPKPPPAKSESAKKERPQANPEAGEQSQTETASADSVRERLLQSAIDRAKARSETSEQASKGEALSAGSGEGEGAAAIGPGGRGGPGIVKGIDFIIYQNRMLSTIKENWAWVGQRSNLRVVVHFGIRENGEIFGLRIVQPSGDPSYDESVLRAVKKSSPLPAPPESYRRDFADVQLTFRPRDLGA